MRKARSRGSTRIAASWSIRRSPNIAAASSRPPATGCSQNFRASSTPCAARLEGLAEPGGVLISNTVHDQVRDRLPFAFTDLGEQQLKNIARPQRVYRIWPDRVPSNQPPADRPTLALPDKPSIA